MSQALRGLFAPCPGLGPCNSLHPLRLQFALQGGRGDGSGLAIGRGRGRTAMLQSIRKHVAIPALPGTLLLTLATVTSFGVLLAHDLVHPVVVYALQLYLSF